ncbi:MAG TPA: AIPR family protein, partial [Methylococcales bacterium]
LADDLVSRLQLFMRQASENDRLVLEFATIDPLNEKEFRALNDISVIGQNRMGTVFDVKAVSVRTIYEKSIEAVRPVETHIPIQVTLTDTSSDLLVGTITLENLYNFLKSYQKVTDDLDQIYEKNVRRFLGGGGRVNAAIQKTIETHPERFGLYNNGITVIVNSFKFIEGGVELVEPYIVNGCQTTRTIWEVLRRKLESGGTGYNPDLDDWKQRLHMGVVVTKIVRVGATGENLLVEITRFTNSQNAVREKDFLALVSDFKSWQTQMEEQHDIYLEIQRGGWDSRKAYQKQHPTQNQFKEVDNAFDLLKVFGAGWLGEAGMAFGKNAPFLPNGSVYKRIVNLESDQAVFGVEDLYAAYFLQKAADGYGFGRGAKEITRRQTRFLYYFVAIDILKDIMTRAGMLPDCKSITKAVFELFKPEEKNARDARLEAAIESVDTYLTAGLDDTVFLEPAYTSKFNSDMNAFLKWDDIGKSEEYIPRLRTLLAIMKSSLGRRSGGQPSQRDLITGVIR